MPNEQLTKWMNEFGDDYTDRNLPDDAAMNNRLGFWFGTLSVVPKIPESILEVGANIGANLTSIDKVYKNMLGKRADLYYIEPNEKANRILQEQNPQFKRIHGEAKEIHMNNGAVELAFTCGVLIHIPPDELNAAMKEIYRVSRKYIICAEYFSPEEREIKYRGQNNMLWARDYGAEWLDKFNLRCVSYSFAWKRITGMDNLTVWLMEKVD